MAKCSNFGVSTLFFLTVCAFVFTTLLVQNASGNRRPSGFRARRLAMRLKHAHPHPSVLRDSQTPTSSDQDGEQLLHEHEDLHSTGASQSVLLPPPPTDSGPGQIVATHSEPLPEEIMGACGGVDPSSLVTCPVNRSSGSSSPPDWLFPIKEENEHDDNSVLLPEGNVKENFNDFSLYDLEELVNETFLYNNFTDHFIPIVMSGSSGHCENLPTGRRRRFGGTIFCDEEDESGDDSS